MGIWEKYDIRALIIGMALSVLVTLYSAYAGLKVGGVYWPILTTTLAAMAILKFLGKTGRSEINIAQAAGSAGGLLAAGVIFTVPAIYMLGMQMGIFEIFLMSLAGGLLGILFSYPLRHEMIERDKLPYADGTAAAAMIESGDGKGGQVKIMAGGFGLGAILALARDHFAAVPAAVNLETMKVGAARFFSFGSIISLIPLAGGYLIGFAFTAAWFSGAVITYFVIAPNAVLTGAFTDKYAAISTMAKPLGIGIVIGSALAYFAFIGLPRLRAAIKEIMKKGITGKAHTDSQRKFAGGLLVLAALLAVTLNLDIGITIIALGGAFAMAYLGARVTGEMNVDPMEIFAIIALLAAKILFGAAAGPLVVLAAVVCISAGVAGDMMQDMKAGRILGTDPNKLVVAQVAGVVVGAAVIGFLIVAIGAQYQFGGVEFPAPQAVAIKEVVAGAGVGPAVCLRGLHSDAINSIFGAFGVGDCLGAGAMLGILMTIAAQFIGSGAIPIAFGIGMYVPIELSFPLFVGGVARYFADYWRKTEMFRVLAAGMIAGEGLIGAIIAIVGAAALLLLH